MIRVGVTLLVGGLLAACSPQPGSTDYYVANPDEAARVLAACKRGSQRGQDCVNATAGVAAGQSAERMKLYKKNF
jgi:hypothetical protein